MKIVRRREIRLLRHPFPVHQSAEPQINTAGIAEDAPSTLVAPATLRRRRTRRRRKRTRRRRKRRRTTVQSVAVLSVFGILSNLPSGHT